ncbi:MAG TPA: LamG domain-containing protein [Candidatus Paceibacterota bacterium]|nr:LamG domain-containing protein [Candidatus Paceibacterota bacterium]
MRFPYGLAIFFIAGAFLVPGGVQAAVLSKPVNNFGLAAFWPLDEGTGSAARDVSGNGKNGTLVGSPAWTTGRREGALNFTGSNYVTTAISSVPTSGSISLWAYPTSYNLWISPAGWKATAVTNTYLLIDEGGGSSPGTWRAVFRKGSSGEANIVGPTIQQNAWTHVVMTWSLSGSVYTITLYINGVQYGSPTTYTDTGGSTSYGNFAFGTAGEAVNNNYSGKIDDVRVFNRTLTATEVKSLYSTQATVRAPNNLGLAGYWPFDEGSGAIAGDMSGNRNNGTLSGSTLPSWVGGKHGGALSFDGTGGYVSTPSSSALNLTSSITIAAWVKVNSNVTNYRMIISKESTAGTPWPFRFYVEQTTGKLVLDFTVSSAIKTFTTSTAINDNMWHHVVAVRDDTGKTVTVYIDGVSRASGSYTGTVDSSATAARIGISPYTGGGAGGSYPFIGNIDELRVYSRALSASEIAGLYSQGAAQINTPSTNSAIDSTLGTGLVGLWTFDGADLTDKIYDRSGSGNNAYFDSASATSSRKAIGKLGQGLRWPGTAAYARVATFSNPPSSAMSICAWIKTSSDGVLLNINRNVGNIVNEGIFKIATGKLLFWDYNGSSYGFVDGSGYSNTTVTNGMWHHICFTKNGTAGTYYLDGAADGTKTGGLSISYGTADWVLAADYRDSSTYFSGSMDDVRIYNRTLSAAEIKQLYLLGQ